MDDAVDASGRSVRASDPRVRVNGRRVTFDLTSGEVLAGPPAIRGHFVCLEQMADVIGAGNYSGRLYLVAREDDARLAEAEYMLAKSKERAMERNQPPTTAGITVRYGDHGTFLVKGQGDTIDTVLLEAADGKVLQVPMNRYLTETVQVAALEPAPARVREAASPYKDMEADGTVHLDDGDIDRAVQERVNLLFESDGFMDALVDRISQKLATTFASAGQDSLGDAIANSGEDNGSTA